MTSFVNPKFKILNRLLTILPLTASTVCLAQFPRTVLLETSESTVRTETEHSVCAKLTLQETYADNQLVVIAHHWDDVRQDTVDPFVTAFSKEWASQYAISDWKSGAVDGAVMPANAFSASVAERIAAGSHVKVTLPEVLYEPNYNEFYVRINAQWGADDDLTNWLRFHTYLMTRNATADQLMDDASNGLCSVFSDPLDTFKVIPVDTTDTIYITGKKAVTHTDVAIFTVLDSLEVTSEILSGKQYNAVMRFTKPTGRNLNDLYMVAFVASNEVLNATQTLSFKFYDQDNLSDPNHPDNPENPNSVYHPSNWPEGVDEREMRGIHVWPNPAIGSVTVSSGVGSSVRITDLLGKTLLSGNVGEQGITTLDLTGVQHGLYFISIETTAGERQVNRLVIR